MISMHACGWLIPGVLVALDPGAALAHAPGGQHIDLTDDVGARATAKGPRVPRAETNTLFINMDGVTLTQGADDAVANQTVFGDCAGAWQAWGSEGDRASLVQAVRTDWEPFGVNVTSTRPDTGPYIMTVVSPNTVGCAASWAAGYAMQDCAGDPSNVVFAFPNAGGGIGGNLLAAVVGQEIGHAVSLAHVSGAPDILNPQLSGDPGFNDTCLPMSGQQCGPTPGCGSGQQNSYQYLMSIYGPGTPDTAAPFVEIIAPEDGAQFPEGASFRVQIESSDDRGVERLELYNGTELIASSGPATGFDASMAPAGEYALMVKAYDGAGNEGISSTIHVSVGDGGPPPPGTGGSDDAGSSGETDGTGGGEGGGAGEGGLPPGFEGRDDGGCGCRGGRHRPVVFAWLILLAACARRRA